MVGEDVGARDRPAEVSGAEERDVVLAARAQDLADLRHERVDVVADAALAELAEAGQVTPDLGRVDVRVVGELLRGDRVLAHLLRLCEHLQVAREAGGHPEREPLPGGGGRRQVEAGFDRVVVAHEPTVSSSRTSARRVDVEFESLAAVHLHDRNSLSVGTKEGGSSETSISLSSNSRCALAASTRARASSHR